MLTLIGEKRPIRPKEYASLSENGGAIYGGGDLTQFGAGPKIYDKVYACSVNIVTNLDRIVE